MDAYMQILNGSIETLREKQSLIITLKDSAKNNISMG